VGIKAPVFDLNRLNARMGFQFFSDAIQPPIPFPIEQRFPINVGRVWVLWVHDATERALF
jgi:hypothetical protein